MKTKKQNRSRKHTRDKRSHISQEPPQWLSSFLSAKSDTGVEVTDSSAMTLSAVFGAIRILSETLASLPLIIYRRLKEGKDRDIGHALYPLLHDNPNPEMTSFSFRESSMAWLCLRGNSYAEIERDGASNIKALWPIAANLVTVLRTNGNIRYLITLPNGKTAMLFPDEMLHIKGLSLDGLVGLSPIAYARESIGLGLAAQEYGARLFANNTTPKGVIEYPGKFKDANVLSRLKGQIEEAHRGLTNAHRVMILEENMKWHQTGIAPEDAQFLESRKFQVVEIARMFRIPPHMLMDLDRATFSNVEQQAIDFVVHTMRPWFVRWEQEINRSLLSPGERTTHYAEFLIDALMRGDIISRYTAYGMAITNGWQNADEIREKENMNQIPDGKGKEYLRPLNMTPSGKKLTVGDAEK